MENALTDEFYDDYITLDDCFDCIKHSFGDIFYQTILTTLLVNLGLKVTLQIVTRLCDKERKEVISRVVILLGGLFLIFHHFDSIYLSVLFLIYSVLGISLLNFRKNLVNNSLWIYVFIAIVSNELLYQFGSEKNIRLRIHLMSASMKLLSLRALLKTIVIDQDKSVPHFNLLITYLIHPQSLPLGGYFPPNLHLTADHYASFSFLKQSILSFIQAFIFLALSDCLILMVINSGENLIVDVFTQYLPESVCQMIGKLFVTYCTALQFRLSHYFVCFLIQSAHNFWGSEITVAKPSMVELPRSLVDVVIAWDIPMHKWLKERIYKPSKDKFGWASSIFITYATSSFIHGFRFEIWSVLLTLGLLTWIESLLRHLLASAIDTCIEAKSCSYTTEDTESRISVNYFSVFINHFKALFRSPVTNNPSCTRKHKFTPYNSFWVIIINLGFSLLAIFHLAYLGSSFNLGEEQTSTKYVIETWFDIGFYSHIIGLITILFYYLVK
ncbi:protein-serine O-palmitoleoyltransferase porcupine [Tetranychus urticae]|nr:protein-serine O-palmitoleoyltransferase porcupine [Tetranychus urticae]